MKKNRKSIVLASLFCLLSSFGCCFSGERDLNKPDIHGRMQLHCAIRARSLEQVKQLVFSGASVNAREKTSGRTPLMLASENNQSDIVQFLCEKGADIEAVVEDGFHTAAWFAVVGGCVDALSVLLKNKANVDAPCDSSKRTLLTDAINFDQQESIKTLCNYGADINALDDNGRTIVDHALSLFEATDDSFAYDFLRKNGAEITDWHRSAAKRIEASLPKKSS